MLIPAIILILALLLLFWGVSIYNNLITLKQLTNEGWSGIDVQLKRRYDLIPNLVTVVKQYATHEKGVFEQVTAARAASMQAQSVGQKSQTEAELVSAVGSVLAVAENYPELKANQNFLALQNELSALESEIQLARRYYNGAARNYNIATQTFPSNMVANFTGFKGVDYFQMSESERQTPEVKF